jgi:hypothetical protein
MNKIRCFLATFALLAALSSPIFLQGIGAGSLANAAASQQAHVVVAGQLARSGIHPDGPCPIPGTNDC